MSSFAKTSIVYNPINKQLGLPPFYYRWRVCDTNLTSSIPASQYQRLKIIQNTVRVYSSLYASNLASLNAYVQPTKETYGVCWNQMSDRPYPSVQKATIPTGSNTTLNRKHTSVTSSRPGCQTPGGIGCDIKHNSYDRYLNRLKGKGPLRRGIIPKGFGTPIPFDPAFPIYGGKTTKTSIVSGCNCPIQNKADNFKQNVQIYNDPYWQPDPIANYSFSVGSYVYAIQEGNSYYTRALITDISNNIYTFEFDNGISQNVSDISELLVYFPCNCNGEINGMSYKTGFLTLFGQSGGSSCLDPSISQYQRSSTILNF